MNLAPFSGKELFSAKSLLILQHQVLIGVSFAYNTPPFGLTQAFKEKLKGNQIDGDDKLIP